MASMTAQTTLLGGQSEIQRLRAALAETESRRSIQHGEATHLRQERAWLMAALTEIILAPNFGAGSFYDMIDRAKALLAALRTAPAEPPVANGGTEG